MRLWLTLLLTLCACESISVRRGPLRNPPKGPVQTPPPVAGTPSLKAAEKNPSFLQAEKLYQAGIQSMKRSDFSRAVNEFTGAETLWGQSPRKTDATWGILRSAPRVGNWSATIQAAETLWQASAWNPAGSQEILSTKLRAQESTGDFLGVVLTADFALQQSSISESEAFRLKANDMILARLSLEALEKARGQVQSPQIKAGIFFRLAELALENRDRSQARNYFQASLDVSAEGEWAQRAREGVEQIDALRRVSRTTIGAILPLSGKYLGQGQRTLRGLQMGLGPDYSIAVIDSDSNPDRARRAVEQLVKEDQVIGIVGSLLSRTATSVAAKASELDVPSIALSQKSGLTEMGPQVFRNAVTSEMQVRALVKYAVEGLGLRRFAVLYPNDSYGVEYTNLFWDEVRARGGEVVAAQTYKTDETDFRSSVQKLVLTSDLEFRAEEYRLRLKLWKEQNKKPNAKPPEDLLPPVVDFDAIFIPDSAKALGQIAPMLSYAGVKNVRLLGTNLWNTESLVKRAGLWTNQLVFVDSLLTQDAQLKNSSFYRLYYELFKEEPGPFDMQGYDTGLLIQAALQAGASSREEFAARLKTASVAGAIGPLGLDESREVQRPVFPLSVQNGQIVRIH